MAELSVQLEASALNNGATSNSNGVQPVRDTPELQESKEDNQELDYLGNQNTVTPVTQSPLQSSIELETRNDFNPDMGTDKILFNKKALIENDKQISAMMDKDLFAIRGAYKNVYPEMSDGELDERIASASYIANKKGLAISTVMSNLDNHTEEYANMNPKQFYTAVGMMYYPEKRQTFDKDNMFGVEEMPINIFSVENEIEDIEQMKEDYDYNLTTSQNLNLTLQESLKGVWNTSMAIATSPASLVYNVGSVLSAETIRAFTGESYDEAYEKYGWHDLIDTTNKSFDNSQVEMAKWNSSVSGKKGWWYDYRMWTPTVSSQIPIYAEMYMTGKAFTKAPELVFRGVKHLSKMFSSTKAIGLTKYTGENFIKAIPRAYSSFWSLYGGSKSKDYLTFMSGIYGTTLAESTMIAQNAVRRMRQNNSDMTKTEQNLLYMQSLYNSIQLGMVTNSIAFGVGGVANKVLNPKTLAQKVGTQALGRGIAGATEVHQELSQEEIEKRGQISWTSCLNVYPNIAKLFNGTREEQQIGFVSLVLGAGLDNALGNSIAQSGLDGDSNIMAKRNDAQNRYGDMWLNYYTDDLGNLEVSEFLEAYHERRGNEFIALAREQSLEEATDNELITFLEDIQSKPEDQRTDKENRIYELAKDKEKLYEAVGINDDMSTIDYLLKTVSKRKAENKAKFEKKYGEGVKPMGAGINIAEAINYSLDTIKAYKKQNSGKTHFNKSEKELVSLEEVRKAFQVLDNPAVRKEVRVGALLETLKREMPDTDLSILERASKRYVTRNTAKRVDEHLIRIKQEGRTKQGSFDFKETIADVRKLGNQILPEDAKKEFNAKMKELATMPSITDKRMDAILNYISKKATPVQKVVVKPRKKKVEGTKYDRAKKRKAKINKLRKTKGQNKATVIKNVKEIYNELKGYKNPKMKSLLKDLKEKIDFLDSTRPSKTDEAFIKAMGDINTILNSDTFAEEQAELVQKFQRLGNKFALDNKPYDDAVAKTRAIRDEFGEDLAEEFISAYEDKVNILTEKQKKPLKSEVDSAYGSKAKMDKMFSSIEKTLVENLGKDQVAEKNIPSLAKEFFTKKVIEFKGKKIKNSADLVAVTSILRNPYTETWQFIFTDDNGVIVGHEAFNSGNARAVRVENIMPWITETASQYGVTNVSMAHNHPSVNQVTPSTTDIDSYKDLHKRLALEGIVVQNDIVLDHTEYAVMQHKGKGYEVKQLKKPLTFLQRKTLGTERIHADRIGNEFHNNEKVAVIVTDNEGRIISVNYTDRIGTLPKFCEQMMQRDIGSSYYLDFPSDVWNEYKENIIDPMFDVYGEAIVYPEGIGEITVMNDKGVLVHSEQGVENFATEQMEISKGVKLAKPVKPRVNQNFVSDLRNVLKSLEEANDILIGQEPIQKNKEKAFRKKRAIDIAKKQKKLKEEMDSNLERQTKGKMKDTYGEYNSNRLFTGFKKYNKYLLTPSQLIKQINGNVKGVLYDTFVTKSRIADRVQGNCMSHLDRIKKQYFPDGSKVNPLSVSKKSVQVGSNVFTVPEIINIYMAGRQEGGLKHLLGGGVVLEKGKGKNLVTTKITEQNLLEINNIVENEYLDFVSYLDDTYGFLSKIINATSQQIVGKKIATLKNYFPLTVFKEKGINEIFEEMGKIGDAIEETDKMMNLMSPTKHRQGGKDALLITDPFILTENFIRKDVKYHAYAEACTEMRMLIEDSKTKMSITNGYGKEGYESLTQYITDLRDSNLQSGVESYYRKLLGFATVGVLGLNPFVALKQPASLMLAIPMIDAEYRSLAWTNLFGNIPSRKLTSVFDGEIRDYMPNLWLRSQGNLSIAMSDTFATGSSYRGAVGQFYDKYSKKSMGMIRHMDNATIYAIWESIKAQEIAKTGNTVETMTRVGEIVMDIVDETQPTSSIINRPSLARSKNGIAVIAMRFSSQLNKNFALLNEMFVQFAMNGSMEGLKKGLPLLYSTLYISAVTMGAGFVRAGARYGLKGDEDDEEFYAKYGFTIENFAKESLFTSLASCGKVVSLMTSMLQYQRGLGEPITDLAVQFVKLSSRWADVGDKDDQQVAKLMYDTVKTCSRVGVGGGSTIDAYNFLTKSPMFK